MSDTDTTMKVCAGPCGRELPADGEHFYRQKPRGLAPRCKECVKAANRERKAAERENAPARLKRCGGPCGRELPADADHFAPDPLGRPRPRCRECELGDELARAVERENAERRAAERRAAERRAAERRAAVQDVKVKGPQEKTCTGPCGRTLPVDSDNFHRHVKAPDGFQARCKDCVNEDHRERRAAEREARNPPPPSPDPDRPPPLGFCDNPKVRFRMVQEFAERNPRDPTRAARAREIMANADAAVAKASAPPFDANELLLTMADDAEDVDALGAALRRIGWTPDGAPT